jgi:CDP-diacylglycerol---glycerol-3-phosphate 3-phosphatidyltransferase
VQLKIASAFGAFLDPVADKIMVSTALVLLATEPPPPVSHPAMLFPVTLMIAREITMSSLREWAAVSGSGAHKAVKVNPLGKWKTALQMVAMSLLLVFRNGDHLLGDEEWVVVALQRAILAAFFTLWVATALALLSLANYMSQVWHFFIYPDLHAR